MKPESLYTRTQKLAVIAMAVLLGISLSACVNDTKDNAASSDGVKDGETADVVYGTSYVAASPSIRKNGVFFISQTDSLLSYYDFESGSSDVICTDPACDHSSDSCVAYVGDISASAIPGGLAYYEDALYVIRQQADGRAMELLKIDIENQTKDSIANFGEMGGDSDWIVNMVGDTYYTGGRAWVTLNYQKTGGSGDEADLAIATQLVSIDLSSSEVEDLTGLMSDVDGLSLLEYSCVSPELVLYDCIYYTKPILSENEYVSQGGSKENYIAYLDDYYEETQKNEKVVEINVEEDSKTVLWDGELEEIYVDSQGFSVSNMPYDYYGIYKGSYLRSQFSVREGKACASLSLLSEGGTETDLVQLNDGGLCSMGMGNVILSDGIIYYYLGDSEDEQTYYSYSMETGESKRLFSRKMSEMLIVYGRTNDRLVGYIGGKLAWMYKSDFEAGNFSAAHKIEIDFA